ncbi:MAG: hypothetical protein WCK86_21660 [Planctomycetia bacterium]
MNDPQFVNSWLQGLTSSHGQPSLKTVRFNSSIEPESSRFRSPTGGPLLAVVRLLWFSAGPATLVMLALQLMEASDPNRPFLKAAFCLTISFTLGTRVFSYFMQNDRQSVYGTRLRATGLLSYTIGLLAGAGSLLVVAETVSHESAILRQTQVSAPVVEQPQLAQNDSGLATL